MNKKGLILTFIAYMMLLPEIAHASGGGPLIVLFNTSGHVVSFVCIVFVEYLLITRLFGIKYKNLLIDMIKVNAISLVAVNILIPLLVSVVSALGSIMPGENGNFIAAIGTWVFDRQVHTKLAIAMSFVWYLALYILTSILEAKLLTSRWKKAELNIDVNIRRISFSINTISHLLVLSVIVAIWWEVFRELF